MRLLSMDGCTAAAYIAYAFSEVATIYPITPIAEMGEIADKWNLAGLRNLLGTKLSVREMESELGAAGATHGALVGGALATTFTSSQGLLLMIPNMYKISGELLPGVFHVGCRSLAVQALSIFGDHQDVMACRATGFAMLASASVQETHDLAIVAHIAAIQASLPVLHFFDGWRTSNETSTIDVASFKELLPLLPVDKVAQFRSRAMNPEHPDLRGSAQNWDVYFQNREASNRFYNAMPDIVQEAMVKVAALTGRQYHLFDYGGDPDAESVIVTMGSSAEVVQYTVDALNNAGYKYGVVKVRLYRPFDADRMLSALPRSVKRIAVLDRTKEPGSLGEPLYLDVAAAVQASGRDIIVIGGRYGLSSKEFDPTMVKAVFDNLVSDSPKRCFTVGIDDDVTHLSLPLTSHFNIPATGVSAAIFYGMGSDGTVGATKTAAKIISAEGHLYSQAYFNYSAKKSGGYTICQLRFSHDPISQEFGIEQADYIGCNKDRYVYRFDLADNLADGGILIINCSWRDKEVAANLPSRLRSALARKKARLFTLDAIAIARAYHLGVRINMIMLAAFLKLKPVIQYEKAIASLKTCISEMYRHEGSDVVANNIAAIDAAAEAIVEIPIPEAWSDCPETVSSQSHSPSKSKAIPEGQAATLAFVKNVAEVCDRLEGNSLPVSAFTPDGTMPMGTTAYEKRTIADNIPRWDADKCLECAQCSLVCAHASIRPFVLSQVEAKDRPVGLVTKPANGPQLKGFEWRIQVYPQDCTGCGSCAVVCPGHALEMVPITQDLDAQKLLLEWIQTNVTPKDGLLPRANVRGSQLQTPLLQFSGACAGCGETPYVKLLTQLMGERMVIANATGCSSIWGADFPSNAYCVNQHGHGPAWGNSLFEDNAEYGYGIATAIAHRREHLADLVQEALADKATSTEVKSALQAWLDTRSQGEESKAASAKAISALHNAPGTLHAEDMLAMSDIFVKKSVWAIGGDGWAYDIGFAGLDHVLAQNIDINILVMDTECYSNTGGQMSKATPVSAVAKYAANGKDTYKKDLGRMMMTYKNVYVAQVALGGNSQQTVDALLEADAHPGPSIVIAYCPCINHGIRSGMGHSILEEQKAVMSGYWDLYRRQLSTGGISKLVIDSMAPSEPVSAFALNEDRYADLKLVSADRYNLLSKELQDRTDAVRALLVYNSNYVTT